MPKGQGKKTVESVMHKFKHGTLKGGAGKHPKVTSRKQAVAIAMRESGLHRQQYNINCDAGTTTHHGHSR
jgi:hypothetical protein